MNVLGVDLASRTWSDVGTALVACTPSRFTRVVPGAIDWPDPKAAPSPGALAAAIDAYARAHDVVAIALDGPHAWRDPRAADRPGVGRASEYAARTQGKTGVVGRAYPQTQHAWVRHAIEVFDALLVHDDVALAVDAPATPPRGGYVVLECFPTSTWRAAGLRPLPGKARLRDVQRDAGPYVRALVDAFGLPAFAPSTHDDLQAVVCALAAAAVAGGPARALRHGEPASSTTTGARHRIEGFIWDAAPVR